MSRTVDVPQTQSPVKAHVFFNGQLGKFSVLRGDNPEIQEIAFPFSFVVLDADTHKVGGKLGLEKNDPKFKSTLGHPKYGRVLKVWLENDPNNIIATGTWGGIKNNPALSKARFTALIFSLADFGYGKEICCIHLHGRAYSAWLEAIKNTNPCGDHCFIVRKTNSMAGGKGAASLVPFFETGNVSPETIALAEQADFDLQGWLSDQFLSEAKELGIAAAGATRSDATYQNGNGNSTRSNATDVPFPTVDAGHNFENNLPDDLPF